MFQALCAPAPPPPQGHPGDAISYLEIAPHSLGGQDGLHAGETPAHPSTSEWIRWIPIIPTWEHPIGVVLSRFRLTAHVVTGRSHKKTSRNTCSIQLARIGWTGGTCSSPEHRKVLVECTTRKACFPAHHLACHDNHTEIARGLRGSCQHKLATQARM